MAAQAQLVPGSRFRDYQIVSKLKAGGMGTLYLARRTGARGFLRPVAVKAIHPHLTEDPKVVQMFVDEALLSAFLVHPNIVHVEEFDEAEGQLYLTMEYVDGCSLEELRRHQAKEGTNISAAQSVAIVTRVADALHAAHRAVNDNGEPLNVVHRDVSPGNIMLSRRGHVKVIDFGIAKSAVRAEATAATTLKGKIGYMSPEQARGKLVDHRSDIYSLAVVAWELLAGRRAFESESDLGLLALVQNPELDELEGVRPALRNVISQALSIDPSQRPQSAAEFRRALTQALPEALDIEPAALGVMADSLPAVRERGEALLRTNRPASEPPEPSAEDLTDTLTDLPQNPLTHTNLSTLGAPAAVARPTMLMAAATIVGVTAVAGLVGALLGSEPPAPTSTASAPTTVPAPAASGTADPLDPVVAEAQGSAGTDPESASGPADEANDGDGTLAPDDEALVDLDEGAVGGTPGATDEAAARRARLVRLRQRARRARNAAAARHNTNRTMRVRAGGSLLAGDSD